MFRAMRRIKQQTTDEECEAILAKATRGVLSVIGDDGYPYGVPVDFYYEDGVIYLHGAKSGHKIDAIRACDKVSFTAWVNDHKDEGEWFWHVTSVVAFGRAELVGDEAVAEAALRKLGAKYAPADYVEKEMRTDAKRTQVIAVHIEHLTGKHVKEK